MNDHSHVIIDEMLDVSHTTDADGTAVSTANLSLVIGGENLELQIYRSSQDGYVVIQIDTDDSAPEGPDGPLVRVNMNEATATEWEA